MGILTVLSTGAAKAEHEKASKLIAACQVAEVNFCEHFSAGAFQAYEDMHVTCPSRELHSSEVWEMMKAYFLSRPDLRLPTFAAYVHAAASEKYPCATSKPFQP
jgi:hypothetical protein